MNYGKWPNMGTRFLKTHTAVPIDTLQQICHTKYVIRLDNSILESNMEVPVLRRRPKTLPSLRRFWGRVANFWPIPNSCGSSWPLYFYYRTLITTGQEVVAREILHYARFIMRQWKTFLNTNPSYNTTDFEYLDDFVRHYLKHLSSIAFKRTFTSGPAWMLLTHLHSLTGKAPFTVQQIMDDITTWVSPNNSDGSMKELNQQQLKSTLDHIFTTWYKGEPDGFLSMRDYSNDFMRWATSGGAPRVEIFGSRYRTKWAWALYHAQNQDGTLKDDYDLYAESLKCNDIANVALKEEAQKTRSIITTPLSSYLRQCYLLYRWGKPNIPSPISSPNWLPIYEARNPTWYGCVDGERFDQTVPKSMIIDVIRRLGQLDEETKWVAEAEIESLERLTLAWGDRKWKWNGGLLSGWRLTSLLGSLVSATAAEYIIRQHGHGSYAYGVMGDDIVLYSNTGTISTPDMVQSYTNFGLFANPKKTISGRIGEFLRKVRSPAGSWGYPALGLRSLMYAQPWISKYTYDSEVELSSAWLTYYSRLIPHTTRLNQLTQFIYNCTVMDLTKTFGHNEKWFDWLLTPISAGGGGCIEVTNPTVWCTLNRTKDIDQVPRDRKIPLLLGILKAKTVISPIVTMVPIDLQNAESLDDTIVSVLSSDKDAFIRHNVNKTKLIYDIMFNRPSIAYINTKLLYPIPRSLRITSNSRIVEYLLTGTQNYSGITSITHTKEATSRLTHGFDYIIKSFMHRKRNNHLRLLPAAVTIHAMRNLRGVSLPYGTW